jgi:AraC-like DNA-binding protein
MGADANEYPAAGLRVTDPPGPIDHGRLRGVLGSVNRYTTLHSTTDFALRRFDHPPGEVHEDPDQETATAWTVAFVRTGGFGVEVDGARHRLGPRSVLLTRPGLTFRCMHGEECPGDVCHSIAFDPRAVGDAEHAWERAGWAARTLATPRLAGVERRLTRAIDDSDAFEMERWSLAALSALVTDSLDARARGHYAVGDRDVDAVTATCVAIEADPVARRSVADRARDVGMTGTRLTHAFRRYLGVSPHQYVVRWRLAAAASLLDEGWNVSESCYRSGFENLSHFCRVFARGLGVRASTWTRLPRAESRRKVQELLRGRS